MGTIDRVPVRIPDDTAGAILPEGTRVRSTEHPELTGVIKHWEWNQPGILSPIPYCVGWDDSAEACRLLGWMFVYASDRSVEPVTEAMPA